MQQSLFPSDSRPGSGAGTPAPTTANGRGTTPFGSVAGQGATNAPPARLPGGSVPFGSAPRAADPFGGANAPTSQPKAAAQVDAIFGTTTTRTQAKAGGAGGAPPLKRNPLF